MKKAISKLLVLAMVFMILPVYASAQNGSETSNSVTGGDGTVSCSDIAIDETNFPDPVFREFVKVHADDNNDGFLQDDERLLADEIWLYNNKAITNLTGINFFENLRVLQVGGTSITELDVSGLAKLEWLGFEHTGITFIDLSKNVNLIYIDGWNTNLPSIDLTNNVNLSQDPEDPGALFGLSCYRIPGNSIDLSTIRGFDINRVVGEYFQNGVLEGTVLTIIDINEPVLYLYDTGGPGIAQYIVFGIAHESYVIPEPKPPTPPSSGGSSSSGPSLSVESGSVVTSGGETVNISVSPAPKATVELLDNKATELLTDLGLAAKDEDGNVVEIIGAVNVNLDIPADESVKVTFNVGTITPGNSVLAVVTYEDGSTGFAYVELHPETGTADVVLFGNVTSLLLVEYTPVPSTMSNLSSAEARQTFNAEYYASRYPDVAAACGNNANRLFQHYLRFGLSEGRAGSEEFDVTFYKLLYPDLQNVFGNDNALYVRHYLRFGQNEGRLAGAK